MKGSTTGKPTGKDVAALFTLAPAGNGWGVYEHAPQGPPPVLIHWEPTETEAKQWLEDWREVWEIIWDALVWTAAPS